MAKVGPEPKSEPQLDFLIASVKSLNKPIVIYPEVVDMIAWESPSLYGMVIYHFEVGTLGPCYYAVEITALRMWIDGLGT